MTSTLPFTRGRLLQTLPLQIADQIAGSIVNGSFAPGVRLRETELAETFEVSRATIREALRTLEQRGLVRILPQRGAHVTQLTATELNDLFEVRASLLGTGSRLAARFCTPARAEQLHLQLEQLRKCVGDLESYAAGSGEMVQLLMSVSGNAVLEGYIADFAQRIGRYVRLGLLTEARRKRSFADWARVIAAVTRGNGELAESLHRTLALENRDASLKEFQRLAARALTMAVD
jgi:DNA-binding GntR family transcriptional regulator